MISGDYKLTDVEILYNRLEEKKTELVNDNSKKR